MRPLNGEWQSTWKSRLTVLRAVKMRLSLARVERVEVSGAGRLAESADGQAARYFVQLIGGQRSY